MSEEFKTERQIIDEVNALAHKMLGYLWTGYEAPAGHKFYLADHRDVRSTRAWERAVEVYESLTHTEVHDALQVVLEEEEAATAIPDSELVCKLKSLIATTDMSDRPDHPDTQAVLAAIKAIQELERIRREAKTYDDEIDDAANDGALARPPTGDDYNALLGIIAGR